MSRVRTNQITNSAGTGAPNFPNGVTVTGISTVTGNSQAGGNPISGAAQGTLMGSFGGFNATRTTSTSSVFLGYTEGDSVAKVDILANGSATFASNVEGRVFIGKTEDDTFGTFVSRNLANTNTATIYQNGAATFFGNVRSNEGFVVYPPLDSNYAFSTRNAADSVWSAFIEANGKATFTGSVKIGGSAAANEINDYEEGNWTPVYKGGTSTGSYTYSDQIGTYVKIGSLVTANFRLTDITDVSAGSGILLIGGLPFPASAGGTGQSSGNLRMDGFNIVSDAINLVLDISSNASQTSVYVTRDNLGDVAVSVNDKVSDLSDIIGQISYFTAS